MRNLRLERFGDSQPLKDVCKGLARFNAVEDKDVRTSKVLLNFSTVEMSYAGLSVRLPRPTPT